MNGLSRPIRTMVGCSVFQTEVESLRKKNWPECRSIFLPSMMHIHPERLDSSLESILGVELKPGREIVLIFGDCCSRMADMEARPGVVRTRGVNCCDLLLGREEYRRLSHEGAFFLIPEWARRWRDIFSGELGLNRDNATDLMREMHRKLIYLDTGLAPVPEKALQECAEYCGLPYEVRPITLDFFRSAVEEALSRCPSDRVSL